MTTETPAPAAGWCRTCGNPVDLAGDGSCVCWCLLADALQRYLGLGFDHSADMAASLWRAEADRERVWAAAYADDHDGVTVYDDPDWFPAGTPRDVVFYTRQVMTMVRAAQNRGDIPATVSSFSELHDHVDANVYLIRAIPFYAAGCDCDRPDGPCDPADGVDQPYCHAETCAALQPGGAADAYVAMGNRVSDEADRILRGARWVREFGAAYDVPAAIWRALPDVSWHNDACPAFGANERDDDVVVWADHPDPAARELDGGRFQVTTANGETVIWAGDDPDGALAAYREAVAP